MSKNNTIQPYIIQAMVMRLSEKESLQHPHDKGFKISRDSFYRLKRKIELRILDWILYQVCSNEIKQFERI
jgi:hypothetical protein